MASGTPLLVLHGFMDATPGGRRRLTRLLTETGQDLPDDVVLALIDGAGHCPSSTCRFETAQLIPGWTS